MTVQLLAERDFYKAELEKVKAENERLKSENESYSEITEMADNDYAMMQAVEFAEWLTANYVTLNKKDWVKIGCYPDVVVEYFTLQQLYDVFLKSQFKTVTP